MTKCGWKQSFTSPQKAMAAIGPRMSLRPYRRKECGGYHLTSQEKLPARRVVQMDGRRR